MSPSDLASYCMQIWLKKHPNATPEQIEREKYQALSFLGVGCRADKFMRWTFPFDSYDYCLKRDQKNRAIEKTLAEIDFSSLDKILHSLKAMKKDEVALQETLNILQGEGSIEERVEKVLKMLEAGTKFYKPIYASDALKEISAPATSSRSLEIYASAKVGQSLRQQKEDLTWIKKWHDQECAKARKPSQELSSERTETASERPQKS